MPKKIGKCYFEKLTFQKLIEAHNRAKKHKAYKNEVISFEINLENNIVNLMNSLKNFSYRPGKYRSFKVYKPKERDIKSLPYVDRIVHQWYIEEFIKPHILPRFINDSYACLENKGTHKATEKVQKYLRMYKRNYGDFWILKCDVKKFFYSINPNILFKILMKYIDDRDLLRLTYIILFCGRLKDETVGIPIGNYTSQYFANIYLNELDQYVKRKLRIKYYVRYMDDFIILLKTKKDCIEMKDKIRAFLKQNLQLELNDKTRYYPYKMGVNFCGYRIFTTHMLLRTNSKKKIKRKIKKWNKLYEQNNLDIKNVLQSFNSWLGHAGHCNSYRLTNKMINSCKFFTNIDYV